MKKEKIANDVLRVNCSDLEDIGIITHHKGKPFTGIAEEYTNNLLNKEFILKDGLKEGINQYHPNGKLHAEVICENDEPIKIVRGFKLDGTAMNDEEILKQFQVMFPLQAILNNMVKKVVKKQLKSGKLIDDLNKQKNISNKSKKIKISDLNDDQKHWLGLVDMRVNSIPFNSIKDTYTVETLGNEHFIEYKKNENEIPETERQEVARSRIKGLLSIREYILSNGSDAQKYHYKSSIEGAILYANYNGINIDEFKKTPSKYIEEKIPSKKKRRFKKKEEVKKSIPSKFEILKILKVKYIFYIPVTYLLWVIVLSIINPAYPSINTFLELIIIYNNDLEFISLIVTSFVSGLLIYIFSNKISDNISPFVFLYIVFMGWLVLTTFGILLIPILKG